MKGVAIVLGLMGLLAGIVACIFNIFPFDFLLEYFADRHGRFPVAQVYGGTVLFWLLPAGIAVIIDNVLEKIKARK